MNARLELTIAGRGLTYGCDRDMIASLTMPPSPSRARGQGSRRARSTGSCDIPPRTGRGAERLPVSQGRRGTVKAMIAAARSKRSIVVVPQWTLTFFVTLEPR